MEKQKVESKVLESARTRKIRFNLRLNDEELKQLLEVEKKDNLTSDTVRTLLLNKTKLAHKKLDISILSHLSKIGNNINQIARELNSQKYNDDVANIQSLLDMYNLLIEENRAFQKNIDDYKKIINGVDDDN